MGKGGEAKRKITEPPAVADGGAARPSTAQLIESLPLRAKPQPQHMRLPHRLSPEVLLIPLQTACLSDHIFHFGKEEFLQRRRERNWRIERCDAGDRGIEIIES